ncbi:hypothetical protein [Brevibacillus laterosporus]|uniref:hypothetical protein n=1 Tax=Brevibacillus laterosporus TaxID=1465 RepID=UPI003D2612D7
MILLFGICFFGCLLLCIMASIRASKLAVKDMEDYEKELKRYRDLEEENKRMRTELARLENR